jgi:hypothetical protein
MLLNYKEAGVTQPLPFHGGKIIKLHWREIYPRRRQNQILLKHEMLKIFGGKIIVHNLE